LFSGIVEEIGKIAGLQSTSGGLTLKIQANTVIAGVKLGDSISVSGTCLTVVEFGDKWFAVEASNHTLSQTRLGQLNLNSQVNLERALRVSDRFGGHLVSGHVDCIGRVVGIAEDGFSRLVSFQIAARYLPYLIDKGSVAVDGVSLTVAKLVDSASGKKAEFSVALIPHTMEVTTLGNLAKGATVNIELDLIGKYVARWMSPHLSAKLKKEGLTLQVLAEHGYTGGS
jgi:riboflavin synthase